MLWVSQGHQEETLVITIITVLNKNTLLLFVVSEKSNFPKFMSTTTMSHDQLKLSIAT